MRRFAQSGSRKDLLICAQLLKQAPDADTSKKLLRGFEEAYQGRPLTNLPPELTEALAKYGGESVVLGLRQNKPAAVEKALAVVADDKADNGERLQYIQIFGEVKQPRCVPSLLNIVEKSRDDGLRIAALTALSPYSDEEIGRRVVAMHGKLTDDARSVAQTLLTGRKTWAGLLLDAVDQGKIDRAQVPVDSVRKLTVFKDEHIASLLKKHWGNIEGATTAEMQQEIARLQSVLNGGTGNRYAGKKLFNDSCAKCHVLFGKGGQVGPDLTTFKRDDVSNMLMHIVNPSAEIREGFETILLTTTDGRVLTGVLVEKDNQVVVLRGADGQNVTVRKTQIEEMGAQKKSLMPEGLLKELKEQQVRDLFSYLRSTQPLAD
jgi:putative heme-binding domain-containing protein